jgi:hypothetical protein
MNGCYHFMETEHFDAMRALSASTLSAIPFLPGPTLAASQE